MDEARIQEEARRAKATAVEMFNAGALNAAKEFAVKAMTLDPNLLGVVRLNAVLDVHMAYEKKINGEVDWYGILSADPSEDIGTVIARFITLSSTIFSDIDDSIGGTDEATKILMDAYRHISEEKNTQVRERPEAQPSSRVRFENADSPSGVTSPVNQSGMINGGERKRKEPLSTNELHAPQCRRISEDDAGIRGDTHVLTPSLVQIALDATETSLDMYVPASHQHMNNGASSSGTKTLQEEWEEEKRVKGISEEDLDMVDTSLLDTEFNNVPAHEFYNFDEDLMEDSQCNSIGAAAETFQDSNNGDEGEGVEIVKEEEDPNVVDTSVPDHDFYNFDEDLMEGSQHNNNVSAAAETFQDSNNGDGGERVQIVNEEEEPYVVKTSVSDPDLYNLDEDLMEDSLCNNIGAAAAETFQDSNNGEEGEGLAIFNEEYYDPYEVDMSVPDPDFYDFDQDRTKDSFQENEVWALYDEYGMPRIYALVHKVVSREPFKLRMSWLNSRKNDELGPMRWIESCYYKTSGNFSIGKRNVWALFKNWSPAWNLYTSPEEMNHYDMVQVLEDIDDEGSVEVAPLVKVAGLRTVFKKYPSWKIYPREELFRFSHQVSFKLITGEEGPDAPEGCLELDPAAMSPDLLKVFTVEEMREVENAMERRAS
ncbi:PREDICTED: uncharacterized protein LOC104728770 [Camelina sativa]|uniref:Uncharacterized protein LOC104728770 n=1 Tax=Camelina sativa TaxID=90675 RepID=A0ABM0UTB8_CAMSA|nr:PREDICTED: uncharacterized protein LOC104728770 [Camelina sativa]